MMCKSNIIVTITPLKTRRKTQMEQVKISFYAPKSLRTELNVIAAKQDKTVTSILTELVEEFVSENK
jgi:hypothetical protein